jgi:hypothetical protein
MHRYVRSGGAEMPLPRIMGQRGVTVVEFFQRFGATTLLEWADRGHVAGQVIWDVRYQGSRSDEVLKD